jgi:hypothetical protein
MQSSFLTADKPFVKRSPCQAESQKAKLSADQLIDNIHPTTKIRNFPVLESHNFTMNLFCCGARLAIVDNYIFVLEVNLSYRGDNSSGSTTPNFLKLAGV